MELKAVDQDKLMIQTEDKTSKLQDSLNQWLPWMQRIANYSTEREEVMTELRDLKRELKIIKTTQQLSSENDIALLQKQVKELLDAKSDLYGITLSINEDLDRIKANMKDIKPLIQKKRDNMDHTRLKEVEEKIRENESMSCELQDRLERVESHLVDYGSIENICKTKTETISKRFEVSLQDLDFKMTKKLRDEAKRLEDFRKDHDEQRKQILKREAIEEKVRIYVKKSTEEVAEKCREELSSEHTQSRHVRLLEDEGINQAVAKALKSTKILSDIKELYDITHNLKEKLEGKLEGMKKKLIDAEKEYGGCKVMIATLRKRIEKTRDDGVRELEKVHKRMDELTGDKARGQKINVENIIKGVNTKIDETLKVRYNSQQEYPPKKQSIRNQQHQERGNTGMTFKKDNYSRKPCWYGANYCRKNCYFAHPESSKGSSHPRKENPDLDMSGNDGMKDNSHGMTSRNIQGRNQMNKDSSDARECKPHRCCGSPQCHSGNGKPPCHRVICTFQEKEHIGHSRNLNGGTSSSFH